MLDAPALAARQPAASGEREFKFGPEEFRTIAAIMREETGINLPESKAPLVYARLVKRVRELELTGFAEYTARLTEPSATDERRHMLTALTTNVTRFFREPHHFKHLAEQVIAPLRNASRSARIRIWSSACSTGQEPYSIASVVASLLPEAPRMDLKILATDIDQVVLQQAASGRFPSIDDIPPDMRRWFEPDGGEWLASPVLRNLITFKPLNLNAAWPVRGPFDAIFCRNVAIYFDQDTQRRLWSAFASVMQPGNILYIGHSERVNGPAAGAFDNIGITTYRRRSVDA